MGGARERMAPSVRDVRASCPSLHDGRALRRSCGRPLGGQETAHCLDIEIASDENEPRASIVARPCLQPIDQMDHVLYAMDDGGSAGIIRQGNEAFDAKQVGARSHFQYIHEEIEHHGDDRLIQHEDVAADGVAVPVAVMVMAVAVVVVMMRVL